MKWDKRFHIILFSIIAVLAVAAFLQYRNSSTQEKFVEDFLLKFKALNPERALQGTTQQELVSPDALQVPILVYHSVRPKYQNEPSFIDYYDITPELLETQLKYFKDFHYTIISFADMVAAIKGTKLLPKKSIVLTFDDGWENQYTYAFPILKKYHATATFFIFTNAIDHLHFLTWNQIKTMRNAGMTIGAHTKSHPYLFEITSSNVLREEIIGSKKVLEAGLGEPIRFFAYPFGYYNDQIIKIVKEAGFEAARSTKRGAYHAEKDLFRLRSIEVTDDFNALIQEVGK